MKSLVSSSDDASDQESNMDKYTIYSKDNKVYELKNSGYMKKKIISAIKKSLKTNNNKHSLTLNDVSVSEEKEIGNGCRQSLNIRIALDDKLYFTGDAGDGPINIETFKLNDSTPAVKCCSHCSGKEHKTEDDWPAYFSCVKCARKEKRKWYHENCKDKCCTTTSIYCDNCLRFKLTSIDHNFDVLDNKFAKYMYVVTCPNGGGISLHMDYEKIMHFTQEEQNVIAKEFLKEAFKEDKKGFAQFTIAIVHNGASYMPDLLKLLAELHPTLPVKTTKLKCNTETEVMDLGTYYTKVKETYSNGTFAFNPLNEIQAASVKNDECGAYLPELLSLLEKSAFLTQVLPWSDMTTKRFKSPHESDDGPIFWCRPGEQIVSLDRNSKRNRWNADEIESFLKERQQNLKFFCEKKYIVEELKKYRRSYSSREVLFEDRTRPHADQVWGNHFECTAAVGVIQAIHPDEIPEQNRACKEIVVFHAKHFEMLEALLHIDVTAAPKQQCAEWLDDAKLNMIRQMNIRYSKLHLYDNDIYFIPRKIVHQFKTISATLSVAWHTRLIEYYLETDPPPTSEPGEGSETAATSAGIKGEALSDNEDASSTCSSDSLPPPTKTRKTPIATPKKKRKLSCSRSTASTDTEVTPRKRKKPRSRSSTPQKRAAAEKTPKKRLQKTPKKVLVLEEEEEESEDKKPEIAAPPSQEQKRSPSPEIPPQPAEPPSQFKESPSQSKESPSHPKESNSSSRSGSPVVAATPTKKKSPSRSPSSAKKRESDDIDTGEHSKKKKHRSRSRSRSRKHSDTSSVDKDRTKTDSSESKSTSKKKKKDKSRSKSPKKSDKTKDTSSAKNNGSGTPSKSSKKSSHSSSSKKHSDDRSKSSAGSDESDKHRKKHRSDKDKKSRTDSHRSDSSPKKECEKTPSPVSVEPPSQTSTTVTAEPSESISTTVAAEPPNPTPTTATSEQNANDFSGDIEPPPKSPLPSTESLSTEKYQSPLSAPSLDNVSPSRSASPAGDTSDPEDNFTVVDQCVSPLPDSPPTVIDATPLSPAPPPEPEPEEPEVDVASEESNQLETPSTQVHIKDEPKSPSVPENGPVRINHEAAVKPEPREEVASSAPKTVKEEPETQTTTKQKDTDVSIPAPVTKSVPEKPIRKPTTSSGIDAPRGNKDHRNKEKLWDTPLFMPQDCDKYEWTKRSSSTTVASNRISTKNGDKIVKQKTLNSLQNHNKPEDKNTANNTSASAKPRSRSKSPPPWIKKRERKTEDSNKPAASPELKKPVTTNSSGDKRSSSEKEKASSSDKLRDKEKKTSEHKRSKETSSASKKDRDKSEQQPEKKKSSHTKESSSGKSAVSAGSSSQSEKSHSGSKDHTHEKRKRSRSPPSSEKHRDKHLSSSSKKHKKHRSRSRDRRETSAEKTKPSTSSSTTQDAESKEPTAAASSSTVTVSLKNVQDAELAANYKLMIPRVQIVDIGTKYKTGGVQETSSSANNDSADIAESASATNANDQNASSETSDEVAPTVDSETENQSNE